MKYLLLVAGLVAAAVIATLARYESLDPCDWLAHDMARALDAPSLLAEAKIRADFLLRGITEPQTTDCLTAWWDLKADGVPSER